MKLTDILLIIVNFTGALAVFLFAMKLMSEGLQKAAGSKMRTVLGKMTGNRLNGILTGMVQQPLRPIRKAGRLRHQRQRSHRHLITRQF